MDAVVAGSGPNGLAAALTLARAGLSVTVVEASATIGGGTRSEELTLPGFLHDVCSAIHPLGVASPFFKSLPLSEHGLSWLYPEVQLAHPLPDGEAALLLRDLEQTASLLGQDGPSYRRLFAPLVERWDDLAPDLLAPLRFPRHPVATALFGVKGLFPAHLLSRLVFKNAPGRALFCGMSAHAFLPLEHPLTSAFGLILGTLGHAVGWPVAKGGSRSLAAALASCLRSLGGEIVTGCEVKSLADLPAARIVLLDITERQFEAIAGPRLPDGYQRRLQRYRYGTAEGAIELPSFPAQQRASAALRELKPMRSAIEQQLREIELLPQKILAKAFDFNRSEIG